MPFGMSKLAMGLGGALAVILLLTGVYLKGRGDGKEVVQAAVAEASLEAAEKAREASEAATDNKDTRDQTFEESQQSIKEAVDEAIANDTDVFTAYFDSLRASQSGTDQTTSE